ncbi:MAG: hypothetical protein NTU80_04645, partial [Verrucomicrobia bacterium]|nr:hypothetical protein [Verrucomicrobiota bacterium]
GLTIPDEIQRRQERKARLARAKAEIEARAHARFVAEQADYTEKPARHEALQAEGKPARGRPPEPPPAAAGVPETPKNRSPRGLARGLPSENRPKPALAALRQGSSRSENPLRHLLARLRVRLHANSAKNPLFRLLPKSDRMLV